MNCRTIRFTYFMVIALVALSAIGCGGGSKPIPATAAPTASGAGDASSSALLPSGLVATNAMGILPRDVNKFIAANPKQVEPSLHGVALFAQASSAPIRKPLASQSYPFYDPCNPQGTPPTIAYSLACAQLGTVDFRPLFANSGCALTDPPPCPIHEGLVVDASFLPAGTTVVPQVYDWLGKPIGNLIVCPPTGCSLYLLFFVARTAPSPPPAGTNWYVDTHEVFGSQVGGEIHVYFGISGGPPPTPAPPPTPTPAPTTVPPCTLGHAGPDPTRAIRLIDENGNAIRGYRGVPVLRPDDGHDPNFFIHQAHLSNPIAFVEDLVAFRQNGAWDEQRFNGVPYPDYVDYATIAIGLYGAATATPVTLLLSIEDAYAAKKSTFKATEQHDATYTHLLVLNVFNTNLGYQLYQRNAFGRCR